MDRKYTNDGLPKVSSSVLQVYLRDISSRNQTELTDFNDEITDGIIQSNPMLALHLAEAIERDISPDQRNEYLSGFFDAYELLRRQGEANNLEERFG